MRRELNASHVLQALALIFYSVSQRPCNPYHFLESLDAFLCHGYFKRKVRCELHASETQGDMSICQYVKSCRSKHVHFCKLLCQVSCFLTQRSKVGKHDLTL